MGGSVGKSENSSSNQSSFNQNIPQFQQDALKQLYGAAAGQFGNFNGQIGGMIPGATGQMQNIFAQANPAWHQQLQGGAYSSLDANKVFNSIDQSMGHPSQMSAVNAQIMGGSGNTYADAMKNQYVSDANRASDNMLANLDARAAASGMSGGSRHGVATALGQRDINQNLQRNLAETGYNTFDKDLQNKLNIAQQADSNNLAKQQMMVNMLGGKQNAMAGGLNFGQGMQNLGMGQFAPTMIPWQGMQNYSAAVGAPTILSAGQSSGQGHGKGKSTSGGIGGGK